MSSSLCQRKATFLWYDKLLCHISLTAAKIYNKIFLNQINCMLIPCLEFPTSLVSDQVAAVHNSSTYWGESWKASRNTNSLTVTFVDFKKALDSTNMFSSVLCHYGIPGAVVMQCYPCALTSRAVMVDGDPTSLNSWCDNRIDAWS